MNNVVMSKSYNPKSFESKVYDDDLKSGAFKPNETAGAKKFFSIVMPPPNVTGVLHMGHALNITLQDILVRFHRMRGENTLWVPGTDHAGIATQNVVERELLKEGKKRLDLTRDEFLKRTWALKDKHHDIIVSQIKQIGASCDWEHERFTMDDGLSKAVRHCFVTLYKKKLIYKGEYLVNYCPHCMTALSDDEVDYKSVDSNLWYINYPVTDSYESITIATTRPETMFGDTAVAVNPDDPRYKKYVSKKVYLPLTDRQIEIIQDRVVKTDFGTGALKITPSHAAADRDCALRHNLEFINILNPDGTLNNNVPEKYRGMTVLKAREEVVKDLTEKGLLVKTEAIVHEVGHCYRCQTQIEPYLSSQWFVKMKGMADKALDALKEKKIVFYPQKWNSTYTNWLSNIRDWCISRQLWWGHRIPVWYCKDCSKMTVSAEDVKTCEHCGSENIYQDNDVLDTWFSSWLWPFSVMGWPDETHDMNEFFPTSALVTAYDIIFFWVARMIMGSLELTDKVPFKDIYITALVRDKKGRKMSKTLGNGIDPLDVIDLYGSDAMKFTLSYQAAQGQDIYIDIDSFKFGSKFANKIWNAARYILMNIKDREAVALEDLYLNDIDKWIYMRLNDAIKKSIKAYESFKINEAAQIAYDFFWNDFCDWYIEFSKKGLYSENKREKDKTVSVLLDLLEKTLRLLHPLIPLITEEIYSKLPNKKGRLVNLSYPSVDEMFKNEQSVKVVENIQDAIRVLRNLRALIVVPVNEMIQGFVICDDETTLLSLKENEDIIKNFSSLSSLDFVQNKDSSVIYKASENFIAGIKKPADFDVKKRMDALEKDIKITQEQFEQSSNKLNNENFINKASSQAVEKEREKNDEFREKLDKLNQLVKILKES